MGLRNAAGLIKLVAGTLAPRPSTEIRVTRETPVWPRCRVASGLTRRSPRRSRPSSTEDSASEWPSCARASTSPSLRCGLCLHASPAPPHLASPPLLGQGLWHRCRGPYQLRLRHRCSGRLDTRHRSPGSRWHCYVSGAPFLINAQSSAYPHAAVVVSRDGGPLWVV